MRCKRRSGASSQSNVHYAALLAAPDILLNGFGFKWVGYPENVLLILTLCSGVYALRLILANAVVGPAAKSERLLLKAVLTVLPVIAVSAAAAFWVKDARFGVGEPQVISVRSCCLSRQVQRFYCRCSIRGQDDPDPERRMTR